MPPKSSRLRSRAVRYLQLAIAVAAFAYVISLVDIQDARQVLAKANLNLLPVSMALSLAGLFFAGMRWLALLDPLDIPFGRMAAFRAYLAGAFYGLAMPGVIGGDLARMLICQRETGRGVGLIAASVFLERCLGISVLLCILAIGLSATAAPVVPNHVQIAIVGIAAIALTATFVAPWLSSRLEGWLTPPSPQGDESKRGKLERLLRTAARFRGKDLARALVFGTAFQLADLLCTYVIAVALGIELGISGLLIALPLAYLVTALPISPAGLGVREAAFAFTLSHFGVSSSDAAFLALGAFSVRLAVGLLGGAQQLMQGAYKLNKHRDWSSS